jgi:hypothetical protein
VDEEELPFEEVGEEEFVEDEEFVEEEVDFFDDG